MTRVACHVACTNAAGGAARAATGDDVAGHVGRSGSAGDVPRARKQAMGSTSPHQSRAQMSDVAGPRRWTGAGHRSRPRLAAEPRVSRAIGRAAR